MLMTAVGTICIKDAMNWLLRWMEQADCCRLFHKITWNLRLEPPCLW